MIRRALSSDSGFLAFLDLGFGLEGLPSLRDQGSGVTDEWMMKIGDFLDFDEQRVLRLELGGRRTGLKNELLRDSIRGFLRTFAAKCSCSFWISENSELQVLKIECLNIIFDIFWGKFVEVTQKN